MALNLMKRVNDGFNFCFNTTLGANVVTYVTMPNVSPLKKSVCDIGWQCNGDAKLYGTICPIKKELDARNAMWDEIDADSDINKTVTCFKIDNTGGSECKFTLRAILY